MRLRPHRQICAFIDVLGGAELFRGRDLRRAEAFLDGLAEFERRLNGYSRHFPKKRQSTTLVKTFSDNVLVAFPFGSNKSLADGELVARFLGELQMQVRQLTLLAGFPMRGGIVVGSLAMTDQFVFGRALVEAVELEKRAVFPRIVLGESVLKLIPPDSHAAQMVVRDSDGASFLHYLESFPAMMATHREFVETGLRGFASRPRERQKYEWLAQYHNYFAREIGQPEHVIEVDREGAFSFRAGTRLPTPFEALRLGSRAK